MLFLVVLVAVPTFGIETVHPGNLKRIASREALVEFLATAASGKQVSVLSYEARFAVFWCAQFFVRVCACVDWDVALARMGREK